MAVAILDTVLGLLAVYLASVWCRKKFNSKYGHLPLPPGPKGWPIIGNLCDLHTGYEWKVYHNWCKEFGSSSILWIFNGIFLTVNLLADTDIIYLNVAGTSIVVLDTYDAAMELLEKRSSLYSGR